MQNGHHDAVAIARVGFAACRCGHQPGGRLGPASGPVDPEGNGGYQRSVYYGAGVLFGGYKQSGVGREMDVLGLAEYLEG